MYMVSVIGITILVKISATKHSLKSALPKGVINKLPIIFNKVKRELKWNIWNGSMTIMINVKARAKG
jgi:hypothetical protein